MDSTKLEIRNAVAGAVRDAVYGAVRGAVEDAVHGAMGGAVYDPIHEILREIINGLDGTED